MSHKIFRAFFVFIFIIGSVVATPQSARAAGPWYVSTAGSDANNCLSPTTTCATINGAIAKASSGDTVYVADDGLYTGIASEVVLIDKNITLSGGWDAAFSFQGTLSRIDGQATRRGITVISGVVATVGRFSIRNGFLFNTGGGIANSGTLTLNSSIVSSNSTDFGGGIANIGTLTLNDVIVGSNSATTFGGGILNNGTLTLNNSTVRNNLSTGGIANSGGVLTLNNTTVYDNSTNDSGGGIVNAGGPTSTMTLNNSTVSGNSAIDSGGGIANFSSTGTVTLNYSTITNNTSDSDNDGSGEGGGIINGNSNGSVTLLSSIVAGNKFGPSGVSVVTADCFSFGVMISQGYNLTGSGTGCDPLGGTGDVAVTPANVFTDVLGPLGDYGGSIPLATHALIDSLTNPALNAIASGTNSCGSTPFDLDQRGVARPQGAACDIGAFELEGGVVPSLANDNFGDAEPISSFPFSAIIDNTEATAEPGEPPGCNSPFRSVWYSFTPAEDMTMSVDMAGSQLFGSATVYLASGPALSDLAFMACAAGSSTNFAVEAGRTYYLQVDSSFGQPGVLQLNLQQISPPANDNLANAEAINTLPFSAIMNNTNASVEFGEPAGCGPRFRTVWYSFTPAQNMAVQVDMAGSQVFGFVDIYLASGPAVSDLRLLTCISSGNSANFQVNAGTTYYLRLDSSFGQPDLPQFNLHQITPPANDRFADAELIGSLPFSATVDNTNATPEFGEPRTCSTFAFRSVWYSFTPAQNMTLRVNLSGASSGYVDIYLASGAGISGLTSLGCANNGNFTSFQVDVGHTYYLRVDSLGQPGVFQLDLEQITPPANDRFANAEAITTLPFNATVNNTNATVELGEIAGCGSLFRSVWYSFTPAQSMALRVDMTGSQVGGLVSVFRASGPAFSDLTSVACASIGLSTNFQAEAGQTYYLRVDSPFGQPGVLQLNLEQIVPPGNDNFADTEVMNTLPFSTSVDNRNATTELGEPQGCNFPFRTVWYSFTPAQDMAIRVTGPGQGAVNIFLASGPTFADLTSLACVYGGTPNNLQIEGGNTYYFRVDSSFGQPGPLQFSLEQINPPANDSFAGAQAIVSLPFSLAVDNSEATTEPGEPFGCALNRSLWYSFTPAENMAVRISTAGSTISGTVSVFLASGPSISDLGLLTCAGSNSTTRQLEAGQTYYLRLDSFGQAGMLQLNVAKLNPPANDEIANVALISSLPLNAAVDITDAGTEPGEPQPCYFMPNTVWYSFTPAETMTLRANSLGSSINGNVNIYRSSGPGFPGLQFLNCSGPGGSPSFLAVAGQTYYLQAGAAFGEIGTVNVNLVPAIPPPNDNFASGVAVTSLPFNATVDITDATNEPNEPQFCNFSPNTIWYSFTPTETIKVRTETQGGAVAGNVNIYRALDSGFPDLEFIQCTSFGGAAAFLAQAGETYYLQVGGSGQPGTIQFNLAEMPIISGRVTDAVTGTPLPGNAPPFALATLQRVCGEGCFEFVNSQFADSEGRFAFDSFYYGSPLPLGSYQIRVEASLYQPKDFGPFEFTGSSLDVGDLPLNPPSVIRGRAVDAASGNPLAGTSVTLYRCNSGDCTEFVNSQDTDGNGLFLFNSFSYGGPLPGGTYRLGLSDSLHETTQVDISVSDGENRDLGDVALTPLPLIGSISGKLVDKVTGKPIPQAFVPALALHRCTNGDCSEFVNSLVPDSLGRFRFDVDYSGNPIPVGTFQIRAYADQYQEFQGDPFAVGVAENKNVRNIRLTSFPIRFSEIRACSEIPAAGGDCVYSVKITNGLPTKLKGSAWSLVNSSLPDSYLGHTDFQARDKQELELDPGKSKTVQFRFLVPANRSSYGSFICTRVFVGKGNTALFNTIGFRHLFCVMRNATGFAIASPADMTSMQETFVPAATGTDSEPNNSCQSAQDLSAQSYPFVLTGELDSSQNPDVDFFRFTGTPGLLATIDLEGQGTGKGTLYNPYLGFFDSNCNLIAIDDDGGGSLNSRLEITIPADGVFVLATTECCDGGFFGGGNGSYQLTVTPVQFLGSISGFVTDAVSGKPLRGHVPPYANVGLLHCTQSSCSGVNNQAAGPDGSFNFTSDYNGAPLRVGNYLVSVSADQYEPSEVEVINVAEGEHRDLGNIALKSYPIRFSDFQGCNIPSEGDLCEFSLKITNGLSKRFSGKAWSLIYGDGTGSLINFTHFQTNTPLDVSLDPGKSRTLRFRFRVGEQVADGAVICATVFVGQNPNAHFNTVGRADLFCVVKGSTGFTLLSEQDMHAQLQQLQIPSVAPTATPSIPNK